MYYVEIMGDSHAVMNSVTNEVIVTGETQESAHDLALLLNQEIEM